MIYENYKIYGPYNRPDGRQHIIAIKGNIRKTISYPKYLMEMKLGRYLEEDETVHHKDKNPLNNNDGNLEIIIREDHARQDAIKYKGNIYICPYCKCEFFLNGKQQSSFYRNQRRRNSKGPFCSKRCAGKYGKKIQMGEYPNSAEEQDLKS